MPSVARPGCGCLCEGSGQEDRPPGTTAITLFRCCVIRTSHPTAWDSARTPSASRMIRGRRDWLAKLPEIKRDFDRFCVWGCHLDNDLV
jgi:hypothetical protein